MTQLAENPELGGVFDDIFDAEGSEIYLKDVAAYVKPGVAVDFYTVVEAARRCGETAIGYRAMRDAHDPSAAYGVRINPRKSERVTFAPGDRVIVFANG